MKQLFNHSIIRLSLVAAVVLATSLMGHAQVDSNQSSVTLNAAVAESLTLALAGGTSQNWAALTPGNASNASGSAAVTATTTWVLKPGRTNLKLYGYFTTTDALIAASAPAAGFVNIPASSFEIKVDAGAFTPVSGTNPYTAGSGLVLKNIAITGANRNSSTAPVLTFNINLSSAAMQQLPADTYSGTLFIQAQAIN